MVYENTNYDTISYMSILTIHTESRGKNKILRTVSKEVRDIKNPVIQKLILDMRETLAATANGIGLAAPQVGVNLRIFIASPLLNLNQTVFINPAITKITNTAESMEEGCLSLPGMYGKVKRAVSLKVEACNQNGRKFKMKADGIISQLVQHEIGHLNGELFKDSAEELHATDTNSKRKT